VARHQPSPLYRLPGTRFSGTLHHVYEEPVYAKITGEFRMEGGGEQIALPNRHNPTGGLTLLDPPQHLNTRTDAFHPGCTDENRVELTAVDAVEAHRCLERIHLPAERVTPHGHVYAAERALVGPPV
jgi:hypothetical protein